MKKSGRSFLSVLTGLLFFLFLRVDSWLCSLPAWLTLILHFTVGLSIWWFWGTLFVWIAAGVLRYLLILFGRWGASSEEPKKENRNPYSVKSVQVPEKKETAPSETALKQDVVPDEPDGGAGKAPEHESLSANGAGDRDGRGNSLH